MPRPSKLEERVAAVKREIKTRGKDAPISAWDVEKPLRTDKSEFGTWLRQQATARTDRVGALAKVALDDPFWPCSDDREVLREHFRGMKTRGFVMESLEIAFRLFDREVTRRRQRQKNKAAKAARKKNRAKRS